MWRLVKKSYSTARQLLDSVQAIRRLEGNFDSKLKAFDALKRSNQLKMLTNKDYGTLLFKLHQEQDPRAIQVFAEMKRHKVVPTQLHYFFLFGVMPVEDLVKTFNYLSQQRILTTIQLSMILRELLLRDGSQSLFARIFVELKQSSFKFDEMNLNLLIKGILFVT